MKFILIQMIGLIGNLLVMSVIQFNNRKLILTAQAVACVLWIIHYGLLGAMTAVCLNFISFARSLVFFYNDRRWAKSRAWLWLFMFLFAANSILTWEGWRSILPGIAMCLTSGALWTKKASRMRLLCTLNSPFWLVYNLLAGSYSCALLELFALISYIVAIIRFDLKKTKSEEAMQCTESELT